MASSDDLSDQLTIMTKLNGIVERMASSVSKIESSYETQIDTLGKLTAVINGISSERTVTELNKITEGLKTITAKLNDMGGVGEASMTKLVAQSAKAQASSAALAGSVTGTAAAFATLAKRGQGVNEVSDSIADTTIKMHKFEKATEDTAKMVSGKFAKAMAIGIGAYEGFKTGITNVVALSKGAIGFITSLTSGFTSFAASVIAVPLKIMSRLIGMAASAEGGANELMQALENLRKEMGDLNKSGSAAVLETTKALKGFSDTGLSTWRVFGTLAERLELVTKLAVAMGPAFGKLKQEFIDNGGALLAFQKGLGITEEQMKSLGERAITSGEPLSKLLLDITKQTTDLGDAFDIDQKLIGKDIARAIVDVKHFGSVTAKEIGTASVYARKLGVELDKIVGTLDAFETFDTAAENAAKLSQSFGVTVDAFKLMEAQSPAEQIDMLKKSFKDAGVDSSAFNRQQLKLLSTTTGLDEATAKQVFSMKNQGVSLDDIKKKSETAEKKTLTQAQAMEKLANSIERMVKSGPNQVGSFFDMFIKGFLRGIQSSKEFRQMIMFIKRDLNIAMMAGVQLGRTFEKVFPGLKDFFGGFRDFFEPSRFKKLFREINAIFTEFFHGVADGNFSFPKLMEKLQKTFFNFFDKSEGAGQRTLKGFTDFFKSLAKIVGQAIPWIAEQLGKGLNTIADFIKDPGAYLKKASGAAGAGTSIAGQIFQPIIVGLQQAWNNPELRAGLTNFVVQIGARLKEIFQSSAFKKVTHSIIVGMLTSIFAPAVLKGALAGLTSQIGGSLIKTLGATLFKKGGSGLVTKAGTSGISKLAGAAGPAALVAAAAAIGKGVNTYTDTITSSMDHSSKVIAAGATGIIDALTLGLLPDDLMTTIADTFAHVADIVFEGMQNVFGSGFTLSLKKKLATTFELFGSIYDVIAKLFTGDQESFTKSAKELGLSVLRFAVSALEFTFVQLPLLAGRLVTQVLDIVVSTTIKVMTASFGLITGAADSIFGTHLTEKLNKFSDQVRKGVTDTAKTANEYMKYASDSIAKGSETLQDKYLRSAEDQAKIAKQASASTAASQAGAIADAHKTIEKSLGDTLGDIQAAKGIKEELTGPNAIDLKSLITDVKSKLSGIDFTILDENQAAELAKTSTIIDSVKGTADNITNFFGSFSKLPDAIKSATAALKKDAIRPAMDAISNLVLLANQLDSALADGNLNKVDVKAKLANVANGLGLGAKASYTITSKPVNVTVNLTVTMNADDLEQALVMRASSIIRDRINFATGDNAGRKGTPEIPQTRTPNLQKINTAD